MVGLNLLGGGGKAQGIMGYSGSRYAMNAWQVRSWGTALLAEPYVCAFIGWKYDERYFARADIKSAIAGLGDKARQHLSRACIKSPWRRPAAESAGVEDESSADPAEAFGGPAMRLGSGRVVRRSR